MSSTKNPDQNIQWEELISKQEKSGLSQKEFCKQNNIRLPQLGYHRGLIKSKERIKKNQKLFSEVQIKQPTLNVTSEIKIILPNGFQCFISSTIDTLQVKRLMEALLSC